MEGYLMAAIWLISPFIDTHLFIMADASWKKV